MTLIGPTLPPTMSDSCTVPRIANDLMSSVMVVPLQSTGVWCSTGLAMMPVEAGMVAK